MNSMKMRLRALILFVTSLAILGLLSADGFSQDYYVDAENGSNWNGGTSPSDAWQHVTYALTGAHAPLPKGATIHLLGTQSVDYCVSGGEVFPWILYSDISLVGEPSVQFPNVIVDGENTTSRLVQYNPTQNAINSRIVDVEFTRATYAVEATPTGTTFTPTIETCKFVDVDYGISIKGGSGALLYPTVKNNSGSVQGYRFVEYTASGCSAYGLFENNDIDNYGIGFYVEGPTSTGALSIANNDIYTHGQGSYGAYILNFTAVVKLTGNTIDSPWGNPYTGIYVQSCTPWHPDSVVKDNSCNLYTVAIGIHDTDGLVLENNWCTNGYKGIVIDDSDGVVLRGNYSENFLGTLYEDAAILLDNCNDTLVEDNIAKSSEYGILLIGRVTGNVVRGNIAESNTSDGIRNGIYPSGTMIEENESYANGGHGITILNTGNTIVRNHVYLNVNDGILDTACVGNLYSSNLSHDNGRYGARFSAGAGVVPPVFSHNTCADNGLQGLYANLGSGQPIWVVNSIFWNNNNGAGDIAGATGQYEFCCVGKGGYPGIGNINQDPLFVNPILNDYHLQPGSPCIKAGILLGKRWPSDIDGHPRVLDGNWSGTTVTDMGADEVGDTGLTVSGTYQPGDPLTVELSASNQGGAPFQLWISVDRMRMPVADPPGMELKLYGTLLIDPKKIVYGGPVLTGQLSPLGVFVDSTTLSVPNNPAMIGLNVAFQAFVGNAGYGAGQGTPAATFTIGQ